LLPPAARVSGRRAYGPDAVRTLAVIETGQRAGLTLDEIRALLSALPDDRAAIERPPRDRRRFEPVTLRCELSAQSRKAAAAGRSCTFAPSSRHGDRF
jgi:DNA-binding transcriptional MerR regulator